MGKRTSPYPQNPQKELTNAAVVAQFLGIPVPPSANSLRVSEAIQRNIDGLIREIASLKSKNQDLAEKLKLATEQIERLIHQARDLGITLTPSGKIRPSAPPNVESKNSTPANTQTQLAQPISSKKIKDTPQWPTRKTSKTPETGETPKSPRRSRQKQGAAA